MEAVHIAAFSARIAIVAGIVFGQLYLLTTQGILPGVPKTLIWQTGLQALAVAVAPGPLRGVAGCVAAWASVLVALAVGFAWVSVIIPLAVLMGLFLHGDPAGVLWLVGLTAYLLVPAAVAYIGFLLDDAEMP